MSNIGFALTGSFCTFERAIEQMKILTDAGHNVTPIMSFHAYNLDTKFGDAEMFIKKIEDCCRKEIIHSIPDAEPIGPKKMFDVLLVEPCSGNTLAKIAAGIVDTPVLMAVKSHLRNARPVLLAVSTNDALGNSAKNIGTLMNYKNIYFVPMGQDDIYRKPRSIVADFNVTELALNAALEGVQLQPIIKTI
ncbi:MAG: dipicolinate synthase subunit B [Clostridia bacterium]|nr:dipicolinate synthase subunit B [Clostridia bacterium]